MSNNSEFLWCEKYRPSKIEDCVLSPELKATFLGIRDGGQLHNLLLTGSAGLGKTTVAKALCTELGLDFIMINGSEESGIDVLRNKIRQFASSVSLQANGPKVIILDEADYLNPQSTQPALRGFIEEYSSNCRFILTCNFKNRIIEPLHSRCAVISFDITKPQIPELCVAFHKRLVTILKTENVQFDTKAVLHVISKFAPDWRRVLNECQRYAASGGIIDAGILVSTDPQLESLMKILKEKNFKGMRGWVADIGSSSDNSTIFRQIYDSIATYAKPESLPRVVLILADYQYKDAFVADHELNLSACLTEIMAETLWK